MGSIDKAVASGPSPTVPPADGAAVQLPPARPGRLGIVLGMVLGIVVGGAGGYQLAATKFNEQVDAMTQAADVRIKAANEQIQELQAQQKKLTEQSEAQQHELIEQAQAQELALLDRANERERKLAKPDLPVRVWLKAGLPGSRMIVRLHNFGTGSLTVSVTARRSGTNEHNAWLVALAPNATEDIGSDPGWTFATGDQLDIHEDSHRPMTFEVPVRALFTRKSGSK
jgi:hypothetical protein